MKLYRLTAIAFAGAALAACTGIDEIQPESGTLLTSQVNETISVVPDRADATYSGMYTRLGLPGSIYGTSDTRADDYGFIMMAYSNDLEVADVVNVNDSYNWFLVCGNLDSRNADYVNPYIRYKVPYNTIGDANTVISAYPADTEDPEILAKVAQAKAIRAFAYLNLAPYFQFTYAVAKDKPCVPIVTEETTNYTDNPRATVAEVYELIVSDLTYAIEHLEGYVRPDKSKIDQQVAYGLRARAYLDMQEYQKAAEDAEKAAAGYAPASLADVSKPYFMDISEPNWLWGYDVTADNIINTGGWFSTSTSWLRSFSAYAMAPWCQCYSMINKILYDKISDNDVRKGWWVNESLESPLLDGLAWPGCDDVANAVTTEKSTYLPYTNVKFGCYEVGTTANDEDWPFMRVEEMILIQAEGYAKSGNVDKAKKILNDFVSTYRCPGYDCSKSTRSLEDEIWFQRRVELWGEGFSNNDTRRLQKPMVRYHKGQEAESNVPAAFRFNMTADDGWWLLRFPTSETNTNLAVVNNSDGTKPVQDQNGELKDGVTD